MSISFKSRFWRTILRATFKNKKLSIAELRANGVKNSKMLGEVSKNITVEKINMEGIQAEWLIPFSSSTRSE